MHVLCRSFVTDRNVERVCGTQPDVNYVEAREVNSNKKTVISSRLTNFDDINRNEQLKRLLFCVRTF